MQQQPHIIHNKMQIYLDSVDFKEIEEAFSYGFLYGLTTTPTFMHKQGITDIDGAIMKLAQNVPILHVEALGDTAQDIIDEAHRLLDLGLDKDTTYFKIPVSNEGVKAVYKLKQDDIRTNVHLIYTLNQALMAMSAGADYLCVLVGRFQDQGQDSLQLISDTLDMVDSYGSYSEVMFSSVRHAEHVRNAIELGVHATTIPYSVFTKLTQNHLTQIGTDQFTEHTKLLTMKVTNILRDSNPVVEADAPLVEALSAMTQSGLGAVSVVKDGNLLGIFTDGDLRRYMKEKGDEILQYKMSQFDYKEPITISADAYLHEAVSAFRANSVDNIIAVQAGQPVGVLDIQDLVKHKLLG